MKSISRLNQFHINYQLLEVNNIMQIISIENDKIRIDFLDIGGTILNFIKKDNQTNYILKYNDLGQYRDNSDYFLGVNIGRNAGRTVPAWYTNFQNKKVNLDKNEGSVHLHGGTHGTQFQKFICHQISPTKAELTLYDNNLYYEDAEITIIYSLNDDHFDIEYFGEALVPTVFNFTNHMFFNLDTIKDESSNISDHWLKLADAKIQLLDQDGLPTDQFIRKGSSADKILNFSSEKKLETALNAEHPMLEIANGGLDFAYQITNSKDEPQVMLYDSTKTNGLLINSNQEASVIYTLNKPNNKLILNDGMTSEKHRGITFEMQRLPNFVHHADKSLNSSYYSHIRYTVV